MNQWILFGADETDDLARRDPVYLELLASHEQIAPRFDELMNSLPEQQRELILEYLNLALDMEARKTALIWNKLSRP